MQDYIEIMGKGNGQCQLCKKGKEDQRHLFFSCEKLKPVIEKSQQEINKIQNIQLNDEILILGFNNNLTKKENAKISKIIFSYKWDGKTGTKIFSKTTDPPEVIFTVTKLRGI
jgi:hypothetical protein